ncbi:MAG: hypothetical protein NT161_00635 [Candidatus Nomurabacteria bacterium]|nr:hypothetical protein [Candidatus Nomurabacteria bacterium]
MQKNITKKILTTLYLAIFSFGLFVPFQKIWAAPRLVLEANTITPKEYLISVNVYELVNKSVSFLSSPSTGILFKPSNSCTTSGSGNPSSCYITFISTQAGTFTITAWTEYNSGKLESEKAIKITIPKENTSPECKSPKALDWLNRCIDCPNPNIIVKGYCEKKITTTDCDSLNRVLNTTTNRCDCNSPKIVDDYGNCKDPNAVLLTNNNSTKNIDTTYTPLSPLPGLGNQNCPILNADGTIQKNADGTPKMGDKNCIETNPKIQPCPFGNYLNIIIKIIIGFAAVLAMVMIVVGGIEYMTSEVISGKEAGKETITHAILGLLLALGAFLILNTINPQLLSACLDKLPQATITITTEDISGEATTFDGKTTAKYIYSTTYSPNNSCPGQTGNASATCIDLKTTVLPKIVYASLEKDTLNKMISFNNNMNSNGIKWYITEGYPPTIQHASKCHTNGTCLDLNIENVTPEKIKTALDSLTAAGMCPNYEVMGGITRTQLNAIGISNDRIWNGKGTGAHIHVVNAKCG